VQNNVKHNQKDLPFSLTINFPSRYK